MKVWEYIIRKGEKFNYDEAAELFSRDTWEHPDDYRKVASWLDKEFESNVLTEKEKNYLSSVIAPFRDDIEWISKEECSYPDPSVADEYIQFAFSWCNNTKMPTFIHGKYYKGMIPGVKYTLDDLGL